MNNLLSFTILFLISQNLCKFASYVEWQAFDASFQYELQNYLFWKHLHVLKYLLLTNIRNES